MARVTVEDCITKIPNRFELVLTASQRAKEIGTGAQLTVDRDNDKNAVVSLREIADGTISIHDTKENLIRSFQKVTFMQDDEEEETIDLMEGENDWSALASFGDDLGDGLHETDEEEERVSNKRAVAADNEFMVGKAIDPSEVPESMLRYDD